MGLPSLKDSFKRQPTASKPTWFEAGETRPCVVLDTNIVLHAMWALSKGPRAESYEKASLKILDAVDDGRIVMVLTTRLRDEYERKATEHQRNKKMKSAAVKKITAIFSSPKIIVSRLLIDHAGVTPKDKDDEVLFNGLRAQYLISHNLKDVSPNALKLMGRPNPYTATMGPEEFVKAVLEKIT
jgi:predicted nucleic acid-binding protein